MAKSESLNRTEIATWPETEALIADLDNEDGFIRQEARTALVKIGEPAVDALIKVLVMPDGHTRWEAAKALSQISSPQSVQALVQALEDEQFSVRWLAAEGLVNIGQDSLEPLLRALVSHSNSVWLREGAHHVLSDLIGMKSLSESLSKQIAPVLAALKSVEPIAATPLAAHKALQAMTK